MERTNFTNKYEEKIKKLMGRSYHEFFPLVEGLTYQNDLENFIEGYIEVAHERISSDILVGRDTYEAHCVMRVGFTSIRDHAKMLTRDNLHMLARIYEANKGKRINKYWEKTIDKVCPDPRK